MFSGGVYTEIVDPMGIPGELVAYGINNNGVIVGAENLPLAPPTPTPEPGSVYLTGAGVIGLIVFNRYKQLRKP